MRDACGNDSLGRDRFPSIHPELQLSLGRGRLREGFLVILLVHGDNDRVAESFGCDTPSGGGHTVSERGVSQEPQRGSSHTLEISEVVEKAADTVLDDFRQTAD